MKRLGRMKWFGRAFLLAAALMLMVLGVNAAPGAELSKTNLSLLKGKSAVLKLNGAQGTVKWSSSKSSVASVSQSGKVKAKKKGSAVITAKAGGASYRCKVLVKEPVASVKLNQKNIAISVGGTYQLKATVKPTNASSRALKWSSSNAKIVKVSSKGKITAVNPGLAEITAKAKDGSGKKAVCRILVKTPVQGDAEHTVKLNKTSLTLEVGETETLTATTSDQTKVAWGSSRPDVVSVSDGVLTAKSAGTAVIAARRFDGKKTVFCKVTVNEKELPSGGSARAQEFMRILQKYSDRVKADKAKGIKWGYSNSGAPSTWKGAVKSADTKGMTYCNCALLARWGLREMGIIDSKNFWGLVGGGVQYRGDVKEQLLKHCEIIPVYKTPNQLLEEGNLLPGDICTWVDYQHTNVYAGDGLWYDAGRNSSIGGYQGGTFIFNSFGPAATISMSRTRVGHIIRIK